MSESVGNAPGEEPVRQKRGKRRIVIFIIISLLNLGLLALILTQLLTPAAHTPSNTLIGHAAPGFSLAMLDAQPGQSVFSLANVQGKAIVLNFWASWCDPCQEEIPLLENSWRQLQGQGKDVVFLGIDFEETSGAGARFLQSYHITYPAVLDTSGSVANKYGIVSLPDTIFINRKGMVVSKVAQQLTSQALTQNLQLIV